MTIDKVVERVSDGGNLLANVALIDIKTWQTSRDVFADWQRGVPVEGVNTANMGIYRLVNGEPVFDLLGREGNPFVDERFQEDAYRGILDNEFFFPSEAMKEHIFTAINTKQSVTVHYSGLRVQTRDCGSNYGFVEVDGKNTGEEEKLFVAVYGTKNPCNRTRVYLLREDVVRAQLKGKKKDDVIVRACYFGNDQVFVAFGKNIDDHLCAVRGVRRENLKNLITDAYNLLLVYKQEAVEQMTPTIAAGLNEILSQYEGLL